MEPINEAPSETDSVGGSNLVIWGTNVSVAHCKEKFKQFVLRYIEPNAEEDECTNETNLNEPLYLQKLHEVRKKIKVSFFIHQHFKQ